MSLGSAIGAFFGILFNKDKAELWNKANEGKLVDPKSITPKQIKEEKKPEPKKEEKKPEAPKSNPDHDAVYALTLLQREGRLIDFLKEDISAFADDQIGAAVRKIHADCGKALEDYFQIVPVVDSAEGESTTIAAGFDPTEYEITGNVSGEPPFNGTLGHKGWKAKAVKLPQRQKGKNPLIIHPAEVEV